MATRAILTALLLCFSACSVDKSAERMGDDGDEQSGEQSTPPDVEEDPPDAGG